MTNEHPITPPPRMVQDWVERFAADRQCVPEQVYIANRAAQWGADQELEACCEWLQHDYPNIGANALRAARRPKPPSLKEQALNAARIELDPDGKNGSLIIRALETLPDD